MAPTGYCLVWGSFGQLDNTAVETSGEVWPAAGIPKIARKNGAYMIEINLENTVSTHLFDEKIYKPSSTALMELFSENY